LQQQQWQQQPLFNKHLLRTCVQHNAQLP
jgi:hypothetical protein